MTKIEDKPDYLGNYCCKEFENDVLNKIIRYDKATQYEPFVLTLRNVQEKLFDGKLIQSYSQEHRVMLKFCNNCGKKTKNWNDLFDDSKRYEFEELKAA